MFTSGKLDISSFSLDAVPLEVYTRLLGVPPADLSRKPAPAPDSTPDIRPSSHGRSVPAPSSREDVFGIPGREVAWGEPAELTSLKGGDNVLTELDIEIGAFGGLKSIDFARNQLASLPRSFADLLRLTSLDLSFNRLKELPPTVLLLPALQNLNLSDNLISSLDFSSPVQPSDEGLSYGAGFLTTSFGRASIGDRPIFPQLAILDLSYNLLKNEHLEAFRGVKLSSLSKLDLSGNQFSGDISANEIGLVEQSTPKLATLGMNQMPALKSFDGRPDLEVQVEGSNIVTNSSQNPNPASGSVPSSTTTTVGSITRIPGLPVPQPDLTLTFKTYPAATFDSEPLAIGLDLYLPPKPAGPKGHPLIIWFHGGGLLQGNKENLPPHFRRLPSHEFTSADGSKEQVAVISPNYRLAPQVPILDILSDIDALMEFVRTKLNDKVGSSHPNHQIDLDRMCLSGGSAGGYLALVAGLIMPKSVRIGDIGGYRGESGSGRGIKCLAPFYPITDLDDPFWAVKTDPVPWYGKHVSDEQARPHLDLKAAPVASTVSGGPRSILYMYMLQHSLFPSLLFLRQRSATVEGESLRPDPETLSLTRRLALVQTSGASTAHFPPIYFTHPTADTAVQPQEKSIQMLKELVSSVTVETLDGLFHAYDEDAEVECPEFVAWLERYLVAA
ncbi:Alpha/Beta hydrolase protein [Kockovaella imperatae]|uniref:Alpha/Beta hydrolase protein n=1 Tax=Kockovaella imperatae TaxID=4999 RepID=A0A1Y1U6Y2_9TREE|nr:Alpha/Beta hydrolase protein [Kockovaella imperatae]ORX33803.1 Alpha/Beta hydrolase protein [Kockovaella imperatae]